MKGISMRSRLFVYVLPVLVAISLLGPAVGQAEAAGQSTVGQTRQVIHSTGKWIDINLTTQRLTAYVGARPVFWTLISSGVARHKTPVGTFRIYLKLRSQEMIGGVGMEHYDLPNVPYVMYFYGGDAIHGTYWHHNFGHPMSHGCINAPTSAAAWLYFWAPYGTVVHTHY